VVKSAESDAGSLFLAAVDQAMLSEAVELERVAFDCEGVNLSRVGSLEIISICFASKEVFLVDAGKKGADPAIMKAVKDLFENKKIVKIIHDCRMDSDALYHLHGIKLQNVHDTSCFHAQITGCSDPNLNDVLILNDIKENTIRDKSIYKSNPNFWATRPLTKQMIEWASRLLPMSIVSLMWRQSKNLRVLVMVKGHLRSYNPKSLLN
jgi:exonuclease 3'-5' domain-containing protein 1